jgi:hypothetical protein
MWESDSQLNGPLDIYDSFGEPLDREPVNVNDVPLSRLEPPFEILQPRPQGAAQGTSSTRSNATNTKSVSPTQSSPVSRSAHTTGQSDGPATGQAGGNGGSPNPRQVVGSGVRTVSAQEAHISDQTGFAPKPVRKKAAWVPQ